jgi:hypothetical protein
MSVSESTRSSLRAPAGGARRVGRQYFEGHCEDSSDILVDQHL